MPRYRIFQLKGEHVQAFQEKAPKAGKLSLRDSRYEEVGNIEADGPYEAWKLLQEGDLPEGVRQLGVGDVLQIAEEAPLICTWWGFDSAQWMSAEQAARIETHQEVDAQVSV